MLTRCELLPAERGGLGEAEHLLVPSAHLSCSRLSRAAPSPTPRATLAAHREPSTSSSGGNSAAMLVSARASALAWGSCAALADPRSKHPSINAMTAAA